MKQRKPMARGKGFKRPELPKHQRTPIKPASEPSRARMTPSKQEVTHESPKFEYIRDKRLRTMCQGMPCQGCAAGGADWAHSNQAIHGKGRSIKASDVYVAALCWPCHSELDQGKRDTKAEKAERWTLYYWRTLTEAIEEMAWPHGIPFPDYIKLSNEIFG